MIFFNSSFVILTRIHHVFKNLKKRIMDWIILKNNQLEYFFFVNYFSIDPKVYLNSIIWRLNEIWFKWHKTFISESSQRMYKKNELKIILMSIIFNNNMWNKRSNNEWNSLSYVKFFLSLLIQTALFNHLMQLFFIYS
jgi:hypothetical protein